MLFVCMGHIGHGSLGEAWEARSYGKCDAMAPKRLKHGATDSSSANIERLDHQAPNTTVRHQSYLRYVQSAVRC
jgi:hypothetical protein